MDLVFENGDKIPSLGLGTWLSEKGEVYQAIRHAIKIGYRHIDCAAIYGNEQEIGQAFADAFNDGDVTREELWITSKLWNSSHKEEDVEPAISKTLSDLQLTYLDLYLIHWPIAFESGVSMPESEEQYISLSTIPLEETWKGMEQIHKSGLAKHIGVSNFSIKKIKQILASCTIRPEMNQVEMHPYLQQKELLAYCTSEHIYLTGYSPLGRPTADNKTPVTPLIKHEIITSIAAENNCSPANVLLAWGLQRDTVVIPKSVNPSRLEQNLNALDVSLTRSQMDQIDQMDRNFRYVDGTFWTDNNSIYTLENLWDE